MIHDGDTAHGESESSDTVRDSRRCGVSTTVMRQVRRFFGAGSGGDTARAGRGFF